MREVGGGKGENWVRERGDGAAGRTVLVSLELARTVPEWCGVCGRRGTVLRAGLRSFF